MEQWGGLFLMIAIIMHIPVSIICGYMAIKIFKIAFINRSCAKYHYIWMGYSVFTLTCSVFLVSYFPVLHLIRMEIKSTLREAIALGMLFIPLGSIVLPILIAPFYFYKFSYVGIGEKKERLKTTLFSTLKIIAWTVIPMLLFFLTIR